MNLFKFFSIIFGLAFIAGISLVTLAPENVSAWGKFPAECICTREMECGAPSEFCSGRPEARYRNFMYDYDCKLECGWTDGGCCAGEDY